MNNNLQQILDSLPDDPPSRSRLEPYREFIVKLRGRGYSYRGIIRVLRDRCGVTITQKPFMDWVHRHLDDAV